VFNVNHLYKHKKLSGRATSMTPPVLVCFLANTSGKRKHKAHMGAYHNENMFAVGAFCSRVYSKWFL